MDNLTKPLNLTSKATRYSSKAGQYQYHPLFNLKIVNNNNDINFHNSQISAFQHNSDLRTTSDKIVNQEQPPIPIFLDFYYDRIDFGPNNYLVLDSLLKFQPHARIYISVFAFHLHTFYSFSDVLSQTTFLKYIKSGYNVEILRHHDQYRFQTLDPESTTGENKSIKRKTPNMEWFTSFTSSNSKYSNNLPMNEAQKIDHFEAEETLVFFTRLANLYHNGGFYSDFAILWFTNLFDFANKYLERQFGESSNTSLTWKNNGNRVNAKSKKGSKAYLKRSENIIDIYEDSTENLPHMFFYFPKRHDPTIECLLNNIFELDDCLAERRWDKGDENSQHGRIRCYERLLKDCGKTKLDKIIQWESKRNINAGHKNSTIEIQEQTMVPSFKMKDAGKNGINPIQSGNIFLSEYGYGNSWEKFNLMIKKEKIDYEAMLQIPMGNPICRQAKPKNNNRCRLIQYSSKLKICAPSFFIPGTQKGASSFLFHAIALHPQVLLPLKGSQYKEPGVYYKFPFLSGEERSQAFPYISTRYHGLNSESAGLPSSDERQMQNNYIDESNYYISGDGTVIYMYQKHVFGRIYRENPEAKFIFALRNPIDRAFSDYKFNYRFFSNFNNGTSFDQLVEDSIETLQRGCKIHTTKILEYVVKLYHSHDRQNLLLKDIMNDYYSINSRCPYRKVDPHNIILRGLYFYSVIHFLQIFPSSQMKIVISEDLKVNTLQEKTKTNDILQDLFSFLDICPFQYDPTLLEPVHVTGSSQIVKDVPPISIELREKLKQFYKPYNQALYALIGRDLGWD